MAIRILEGAWEDVAPQIDLHGRRVRVLIDDKQDVLIREISANPLSVDELAAANPWLRSLEAWAKSHSPLTHEVDDSRDSLFEDSVMSELDKY